MLSPFVIEHRHMTYHASEMGSIVCMACAILAFWPKAKAIRKRRLESIVILPTHVEPAIHDDSRHLLPNALPHDACLSSMNAKPFLLADGHHMNHKPPGGS